MATDDDALTAFRRLAGQKPAPSTGAKPPPVAAPRERSAYEPFTCKVRVPCFSIRGRGFLHTFSYHNLQISSTNPDNSFRKIILVFNNMMIVIKGRNLKPIVDAMALYVCELIQEYMPEHHLLAQPEDPQAAFIESITLEIMNPMIAAAVGDIGD